MFTPNRRLATALLRIFQLLRIVCIVAVVVLVPAMIVAWAFPESVRFGANVKVNGMPLDNHATLPGTLLFLGNVFLVAAIVTLSKLIGLMRSVVDGTPFVIANVARLRAIAGVLGALFVIKASINLFVGAELRRAYDMDGGSFDFGLFLGALTILVLAEVFREGVRLSDENEGTI